MEAAVEVSECRPPAAGKRLSNSRTRVERRAGEGTEAGEKDAHTLKLQHAGDRLDSRGRRCDARNNVSLDS